MASTFAASISCIDGRVQNPISSWIKKTRGVEFVDVISEPGCDLVLSGNTGDSAVSDIRAKLEISIRAHGSKLVFVSGHHECAANPVSRELHADHIRGSVRTVAGWGLPVKVCGLWINDSWGVEPVPDPA